VCEGWHAISTHAAGTICALRAAVMQPELPEGDHLTIGRSSTWRTQLRLVTHGPWLTLAATEFIRRVLLHVLRAGFHRIRYYGFLGARDRREKLTRQAVPCRVPGVARRERRRLLRH
jgi:hypothetical protein